MKQEPVTISMEEFEDFYDFQNIRHKVLDMQEAMVPKVVDARMDAQAGTTIPTYLPWKKTHNRFHFRKGELTLWGGHTKTFKSYLTGFVFNWLVAQGETCCLASFEMPVEVSVDRMMVQFLGKDKDLTKNDMGKFLWFGQKELLYYDHRGVVKSRDIEALIHYCVHKRSVTHIMLDSLMMIELDGDEYRSQKDLVVRLSALAKDYNICIHMVTHMRKPAQGGSSRGTHWDISGTANLGNIADNVFIVSKEDESADADLWLELDASRMNGTFSMPLFRNDEFQFLANASCSKYYPDDYKELRFIE